MGEVYVCVVYMLIQTHIDLVDDDEPPLTEHRVSTLRLYYRTIRYTLRWFVCRPRGYCTSEQ